MAKTLAAAAGKTHLLYDKQAADCQDNCLEPKWGGGWIDINMCLHMHKEANIQHKT